MNLYEDFVEKTPAIVHLKVHVEFGFWKYIFNILNWGVLS
jgi:hypothetical protein